MKAHITGLLEVKKKVKAKRYSEIEAKQREDELFKIIHTQQAMIEKITNFCLESLSDDVVDISHIRRLLSIINNKERSPIGSSRYVPTKMKIERR